MANFDETLQAARVQAENQLDEVLGVMRLELQKVPTEHRFEMMLMILKRIGPDPFVMWVGYCIALERLLLSEEIDREFGSAPE